MKSITEKEEVINDLQGFNEQGQCPVFAAKKTINTQDYR
jgi:hypothetical protein